MWACGRHSYIESLPTLSHLDCITSEETTSVLCYTKMDVSRDGVIFVKCVHFCLAQMLPVVYHVSSLLVLPFPNTGPVHFDLILVYEICETNVAYL